MIRGLKPQTGTVRTSTAAFVIVQVILLAAFGLWLANLAGSGAASRRLPELRRQPLAIEPLYNDPEVVSDEDLDRTLSRFGLRFEGAATSIARVEHALRFWGPQARFENSDWMSGLSMLRLLVDRASFARVYGEKQPLLLIDADSGVRVRVGQGHASSSHVDHTLAALLEIGLALDYPVRTPAGRRTLRAVVEQSLRDFRLDQPEVEWSALAYALALEPTSGWRAGDGQHLTFGRLAERLMREELPNGVCSANHRLHALVVFLRVNDESDGALLSTAESDRIVGYLKDRTEEFVAHQHANGFWNFDWPRASPMSVEPTERDGDTLADRIIVTGHVLEWWALAPEELQPPREVVRRAAAWLVGTAGDLSEEDVQRANSFLSHAGRALRLWRGGGSLDP